MEARKRQKKQILYSNENQMKEKKSKNNHKTVLDYTTAVFLSILYFFCSLFFHRKIRKKKRKLQNYSWGRTVSDHMADQISNKKSSSSSAASTTEFNWGENRNFFYFHWDSNQQNEINPCNYCTTCTQQAYKWGNVLRHQRKKKNYLFSYGTWVESVTLINYQHCLGFMKFLQWIFYLVWENFFLDVLAINFT